MPSPLVVICDIDETICTEFDRPVQPGVALLQRLSKKQVEIHYLTARPEETRDATVAFLMQNRLPFARNLYLCPRWKGSQRHKKEVTDKIRREARILLSIGDSEEEEAAAKAADIPFCKINPEDFNQSWDNVAKALKGYL
jgi:phosphoglycolate phosphatase-like HAD superfamily hydrolase